MIEDDLQSYNSNHLMAYAMLLMGVSRDQVDQDTAAMARGKGGDVVSERSRLLLPVVEKLIF